MTQPEFGPIEGLPEPYCPTCHWSGDHHVTCPDAPEPEDEDDNDLPE